MMEILGKHGVFLGSAESSVDAVVAGSIPVALAERQGRKFLEIKDLRPTVFLGR